MKKFIIMSFLSLVYISSALAAEDENLGKVVSIGKIGSTACMIKIEGAIFPNTCPTATYQQSYFDCTTPEGKVFLSIGLSAYMSGKTVRMGTTSCSNYGSSVANLASLLLE